MFIYSMEVNIYIGFWNLKMKCNQYGVCGHAAFKNAKVNVFFEVRQGWQYFPSGTNKFKCYSAILWAPTLTPPPSLKACKGRVNIGQYSWRSSLIPFVGIFRYVRCFVVKVWFFYLFWGGGGGEKGWGLKILINYN